MLRDRRTEQMPEWYNEDADPNSGIDSIPKTKEKNDIEEIEV